ncbi:TORC2 serine/threonine protein kinase Tor1 [Schizosaccharomyces pombe]|uniref:Serine/threonine-protein kinase tor1 n=1 Tax=Schizosaccharomyces pombe (strain 972 / ATCC 24843) TaxID=284812 RepID=TOR1_SCHPO|nr:phosphatidylinositol kinase Tor1 [Schizosaccharomyces pombe]O14356.1 RecName: Full=Serine/threonine-protein kinase tor1; AltName: Full=Phosphatidylinositol kinase homolog tor1; AltName: Full=Target of rapamycin kinase 1 [Schizosaccharomyces pombe 972h-]CAB10805.1 phosphatidylinositol kinase Tor1 [Schizosaccharomyces pombe]|eukprot:NP_596275.1 phosphatidylinositol kinase Tor1 [Schizosaccharomyces pombe]
MEYFSDLKNKNESIQLAAADQLKEFVHSSTKELSGESLARFNNDINRRIFELIHSHDSHERFGGILAIGKLIEFESEGDVTNLSRYANYLRMTLPSTDWHSMELSAKVLGHLAASGGTLAAEFVEFEVQRAFEWLQGDRQEQKRMAAILIIKALAQNSPTLVYLYISEIFQNLWTGLRDPKPLIRETAADALGASLDVVCQREAKVQLQCFNEVLLQAEHGLRQSSVEYLHGSLLAYKELFEKSGSFIREHYTEFCDLALRLREHRDNSIRRCIVFLLPTLSEYNPKKFQQRYLDSFMVYLLSHIRKDKEKSLAFEAIGRIAMAVNEAMIPYLQNILKVIRDTLTAKVREKTQYEKPVFECIGMLAAAVKLELLEDSRSLLGLIFSCELSVHLRQALVKMAENIPPLLAPIQERLLNMVSQILTGKNFEIRTNDTYTPSFTNIYSAREPDQRSKSTESIILALETLGTFNFTGYSLISFIQESVLSYLENDNSEIRIAAARTCCQVFARDPICRKTNPLAVESVAEVLEKLLTLGIADSDPKIRETVLSLLDERFDRHLAHPDNIRCLFIALNDEVFSIREIAIIIIGRLALYNPAHVMPSLRKTIIQLLSDMEYSGNSRQKEESAQLLKLLVSKARTLIKPYIQSIIHVILPKAADTSPGVSSAIISALGELASVEGEDMPVDVRGSFMKLILVNLQDQSSTLKRLASLKCLRKLCGRSGYVIQPYLDYPPLLGALIGILQSEQPTPIRREVLRTLGVLGALDPYTYLTTEEVSDDLQSSHNNAHGVPQISAAQYPSLENYAMVAVVTLIGILKDSSLSMHHSSVVQAVMHICSQMGSKSTVFLPQVVPTFLQVMQSLSASSAEFYFQQLTTLTSIIGPNIRDYVSDIFNLSKVFWESTTSLLLVILELIDAIAIALQDEFKFYLPQILSCMLKAFSLDNTSSRSVSYKVLQSFVIFGSNIEEYMHLVLPVIIRSFERDTIPLGFRKSALKCIAQLFQSVNFSDHASRIIHPLVRMLGKSNGDLRAVIMDTLCAIVSQLGYDYSIFIPMVNKVLVSHKISHPAYELLVSRLLKGEPLPKDVVVKEFKPRPSTKPFSTQDEVLTKLPVDQASLKAAWESSQKLTRDDWQDWIRRISIELLKESPSSALRSCSTLAGIYHPLARDLFNVSFLSCWDELTESNKKNLVKSIELAMNAPNISVEILQTLLNLAEYMEREDHTLPIPIKVISAHASKCNVYAKALHYTELQFVQETKEEVSISTIESLITINNHLQQSDAAVGMLQYTKEHKQFSLKETWYEKLHRWDDALAAYEHREREGDSSFEINIGKLRCYYALGDWDHLSELAQKAWVTSEQEHREAIAPLAAAAAWGLGQWNLISEYVSAMDRDPQDKEFFSAISAVHLGQYNKAYGHIERHRDILVNDLSSIIGESYNRAYGIMVKSQMLSELEEIIDYKKNMQYENNLDSLKKTWRKRLEGCQKNVDVWHNTLRFRALVLSPQDSPEMWIKLADLCRRSDRLKLSNQCLTYLMGRDPSNAYPLDSLKLLNPHVVYTYLKYLWATDQKNIAVSELEEFTSYLSSKHGYKMGDSSKLVDILASSSVSSEERSFLARCFHKLGKWKKSLQDSVNQESVRDILNCYFYATLFDKSWYKAWHSWALANFEVVGYYEQTEHGVTQDMYEQYIVPAIKGFFHSSVLNQKNSLQDILRLLNLWFKFGEHSDVAAAIVEGFSNVPMDTWLEVIPQLIARIHTSSSSVRASVHQLLSDIGRVHPQALVYSLTVSSKSTNPQQKHSAKSIMDSMLSHSDTLVRQALLVSQELIRVAILWHELWYEGLEEASQAYFSDHDISLMIDIVKPLHETLEKGPSTLSEISFAQTFGYDLRKARSYWQKFLQDGDPTELNQSWDLYYQVFRRIQKQLPRIKHLELQYVSPKLLDACDLELAVPGTYGHNKPVIRISHFHHTFEVISSKQRPRRLTIHGSDGKDYQYVLKGHEDLRQDERVMQLFGLCNTLLTTDSETFKRRLNIERYTVIPLSPNSGLLGWVPHSDTLHFLIKEFRSKRNILLNLEHRMMLQMAPDCDSLTLLQKLEVFEYVMANTDGYDLYHVLWLKSRSSEAWLDRRTSYTQSLAVMSMVGYILGLGDRHPSNLMMDRYSGKIIHIDFGDCFEVAMHREKFPEKIPFRLTRMLINAMEVSGIQGTYKITCELVMRVLRSNTESLMAVLEAFVYDPLINWRLMTKSSFGASTTLRPTSSSVEEKGRSYTHRARHADYAALSETNGVNAEGLNERSIQVLKRVSNKLTGKDFDLKEQLPVKAQVEKLIQQATAPENLCRCYVGWCSFW